MMKNTMIDERIPVGNPMNIEKNIVDERISVTEIVTRISVSNEAIIDIIKILVWFMILKRRKKKKKRFWVEI